MPPSIAANDMRNVLLTDWENFSYLPLAPSSPCEPANFHDLLLGDFRSSPLASEFDPSHANSVSRVFQRGYVLKVIKPIIQGIAVFLVHFIARRSRANKCLHNQVVDQAVLTPISVTKADMRTGRTGFGLKYGDLILGTKFPWHISSHSTQVGNAVNAFPTNYGLPNLFCRREVNAKLFGGHLSLLDRFRSQEPWERFHASKARSILQAR